jgi:hypothetical protein
MEPLTLGQTVYVNSVGEDGVILAIADKVLVVFQNGQSKLLHRNEITILGNCVYEYCI